MKKQEFLRRLSAALSALPDEERARSMDYYAEIIDERMEDGADEGAAVAALGAPEQLAAEILKDVPLGTLVKSRVEESRRRAGSRALWTTLVIIGSPLWISVGAAVLALAAAFLIVMWALIVSLYAVLFAVCVSGAAFLAGAVLMAVINGGFSGLFMAGTGLLLLGLSLLCWLPSLWAAKLLVRLSILPFRAFKSALAGRRELK